MASLGAVTDQTSNRSPGPDLDTLGIGGRPFWESSTGRFDGAALRAAIVIRGWTVREFALDARLSLSCLYSTLQGRPAIDRTAIAIFETLASCDPLLDAV